MPDVPFDITGDEIHFGTDGGYGGFILYGWPDYDARMYLDALIEHVPHLASEYDGLPVEPQVVSIPANTRAVPPIPVDPVTPNPVDPVTSDPVDPVTPVPGTSNPVGSEETVVTLAINTHFVSPSRNPANISRITWSVRLSLPEDLSNGSYLWSGNSSTNDIHLNSNGSLGGILEDSTVNKMNLSAMIDADGNPPLVPLSEFFDISGDADLRSGTYTLTINGVPYVSTFTSSTGVFVSSRTLALGSSFNGTSCLGAGTRIAHASVALDGMEFWSISTSQGADVINANSWHRGGYVT